MSDYDGVVVGGWNAGRRPDMEIGIDAFAAAFTDDSRASVFRSTDLAEDLRRRTRFRDRLAQWRVLAP